MSHPEKATSPALPLSWPPPGLERIQGAVWRFIASSWTGALVLVLPLLWGLAAERPSWSLGPFEENWRIGLGIAGVGAVVSVFAFWNFWLLLREAGRAADLGYGVRTIAEVATDIGRDTGFLVQGKRHFGLLDADRQRALIRFRLAGAVALIGGAAWLGLGFGLSIVLAARGQLASTGVWTLTLVPSLALATLGAVLIMLQDTTVRAVQAQWNAREGRDRMAGEADAWNRRLDAAGARIALGPGRRGAGTRFRAAAFAVVLAFVLGLAPTLTLAVTTAIGPILADIAVPTFLAVQEMAGAAEVLRTYDVEKDVSITAEEAGRTLQNVAFVGVSGDPEPAEQAPAARYAAPWFPNPDFPDAFTESIASDLMLRSLEDFTDGEREALEHAAAHPAQIELDRLARAEEIDVVSGRWSLPFADTLTFGALPWPRFQALRSAGLARVARAAVEVAEGRPEDAERTLRDLIATGFLLVDEGPTLLDNLLGVELTRMGADGLEGFYLRTGRPERAEALAWARRGAADAARRARAGLVPEDARALLQGVPALVEDETALRGLRWEYLATFNTLAPCLNPRRMVLGPDDSLDDWQRRAEAALVRTPGEQALFQLAERGTLGVVPTEDRGWAARSLSLLLGDGAPGGCAELLASLR